MVKSDVLVVRKEAPIKISLSTTHACLNVCEERKDIQ